MCTSRHAMNCIHVLCLLLSVLSVRAALPDLEVTLAATNHGVGLNVPSGGDGVNVAVTVGGYAARRIEGERSHYLYVAIHQPAWTNGPVDAYVAAEVFDDRVARLEIQYDGIEQRYERAVSPSLLAGSGRWRTVWFHLKALRLGHGQNSGADFRLQAPGLAVRRIMLTTRTPPDWNPDQPIDAESLALLRVQRPAGMELCFGNDATPADAALYRALGVSSIESYVDWAGVEPEPGKWDWSKWDKQVATLQAAKLQWVPFLIAGAAYGTPLWFQRGPESAVFRCLDHERDSAVQSLFNPALRPRIEAFVRELAGRYGKTGVLESLLLGVSGIYGESIYPAGPEGGWTARLTGDYHNHAGWWAADPLAGAAFRAAMREKYGTIEALNQAWATAKPLASFDAVRTFLPDRAPSDPARADLVGWYQQAMTDWSVFWVKTVRDALPEAEIYLCTGGDGDPVLGADFTAQAKAIAPLRAGIRITNEGSDYAHNFTLTREVATATRLYGTFCGFEPASGVTASGNVARIYNASASGARQLHCYNNNVVGGAPETMPVFRENIRWLAPRTPRVAVGIYVPRETWELAPDRVAEFHALGRALRDVADLDFVTRLSVGDGALRGLRTLVLAGATVLEPSAAEAIGKWVVAGGTLVVATRPGETIGSRLHDQSAWRTRLLAPASSELKWAMIGQLRCDDPPAHWQLGIGRADDDWLAGRWHGAEKGSLWPAVSNATMRWTGADPGVWLPTQPGADYTLRLSIHVPVLALGGTTWPLRVNGQEIGRIEHAGHQDLSFQVPAAVAGTATLARLELAVKTWKPAEHGGGNDQRALGMAVRQIEWIRAGAEQQPAGTAVVSRVVDPIALQAYGKTVGQGRTLLLPGLLRDYEAIARVVASTWDAPVDGRLDRRYATETATGIFHFDADTATITETTRP